MDSTVLSLWESIPRIQVVDGKYIPSTAELIEWARDVGVRPRGDMHSIVIWKQTVAIRSDTLYYMQAVHQESDVVPENVDSIRSLMNLETDWRDSVRITDESIQAII